MYLSFINHEFQNKNITE